MSFLEPSGSPQSRIFFWVKEANNVLVDYICSIRQRQAIRLVFCHLTDEGISRKHSPDKNKNIRKKLSFNSDAFHPTSVPIKSIQKDRQT
jgi:hypothetical protein